jgi:transcriptional regulator with XRE-family HTH domain
MEKSLFTKSYDVFLRLLRDARVRAGLTQAQVAERLGATQSFVSKCERGERRLDFVEMRQWCQALNLPLQDFATEFEDLVSRGN